MIAPLLAAALALGGPAPQADAAIVPPLPGATVAATAPAAAPPTPADIMAVPAPLRLQFRALTATARSPDERLHRLVDFLFDPQGLGMTYDADANHTVAESYATRKANCLSFTLLAIALAREAGLDAYGQEIAETLAWRQEKNTIYRTHHVNAGVRIHQRRLTVDVAWEEVIARKPPRHIRDERLLVHYYNNRAAQLMEEGRMDDALRHADRALALDPAYAATWSNTGVLHLRRGDVAKAVAYYRHALHLDPANSGALSNLVAYFQRTGNARAAAPLEARLARVLARDPFHHFLMGVEHERRGAFDLAVRDYRKAIELFPEEHRFHFGLARAYFQRGDTRRAGVALARAEQLSDGDDRRLYHAKLDTLRRLLR